MRTLQRPRTGALRARAGGEDGKNPRFCFRAISADPDDNKFCDWAIAAGADFVVTEDNHFDGLRSAGY